MGKRHGKLGIKQTIQPHWMDRVVQLMLAGMSEAEIRNELDEFLKTQKQSGGTGKRGEKTYSQEFTTAYLTKCKIYYRKIMSHSRR